MLKKKMGKGKTLQIQDLNKDRLWEKKNQFVILLTAEEEVSPQRERKRERGRTEGRER